MHNSSHDICNYTHGLMCYDCSEFFPKDSETYIRFQLIGSLYMAINNFCIDNNHENKTAEELCRFMLDYWIRGKGDTDSFENVKKIVNDMKNFLVSVGRDENSAVMVLK